MDRHAREDSAEDPDHEPPGPADHGRDGGMATREISPELAEPDRD
ncbi:hypothetical protein [Mycolicibacterium iranicum]|nr:hypothetical protein [Mycolicibacterium iranicum]